MTNMFTYYAAIVSLARRILSNLGARGEHGETTIIRLIEMDEGMVVIYLDHDTVLYGMLVIAVKRLRSIGLLAINNMVVVSVDRAIKIGASIEDRYPMDPGQMMRVSRVLLNHGGHFVPMSISYCERGSRRDTEGILGADVTLAGLL